MESFNCENLDEGDMTDEAGMKYGSLHAIFEMAIALMTVAD